MPSKTGDCLADFDVGSGTAPTPRCTESSPTSSGPDNYALPRCGCDSKVKPNTNSETRMLSRASDSKQATCDNLPVPAFFVK